MRDARCEIRSVSRLWIPRVRVSVEETGGGRTREDVLEGALDRAAVERRRLDEIELILGRERLCLVRWDGAEVPEV